MEIAKVNGYHERIKALKFIKNSTELFEDLIPNVDALYISFSLL